MFSLFLIPRDFCRFTFWFSLIHRGFRRYLFSFFPIRSSSRRCIFSFFPIRRGSRRCIFAFFPIHRGSRRYVFFFLISRGFRCPIFYFLPIRGDLCFYVFCLLIRGGFRYLIFFLLFIPGGFECPVPHLFFIHSGARFCDFCRFVCPPCRSGWYCHTFLPHRLFAGLQHDTINLSGFKNKFSGFTLIAKVSKDNLCPFTAIRVIVLIGLHGFHGNRSLPENRLINRCRHGNRLYLAGQACFHLRLQALLLTGENGWLCRLGQLCLLLSRFIIGSANGFLLLLVQSDGLLLFFLRRLPFRGLLLILSPAALPVLCPMRSGNFRMAGFQFFQRANSFFLLFSLLYAVRLLCSRLRFQRLTDLLLQCLRFVLFLLRRL